MTLIDWLYYRYIGRRWDEILWGRLLRSAADGYLRANVEFGTLLVDSQDRGISKELCLHHVHEPVTTEFLKGFLREGMVVFDIGSNIGYYVLLEKHLIGNRGRVVAIEPVPHNLELLRQNTALNALSGVTVVEAAVGDRDGVGTLYISEMSNWHSMFRSGFCQRGAIEVPMYTVDSLVRRLELPRVDFIRMDVEGYETNVLKGMRETLREFRPLLLIELHANLLGGQEIASLLKELKALSYQTAHVVEREFDFAWIRPAKGPRREPLSIDDLLTAAVEGAPLFALTAFAACSAEAEEG
jgi:FkbM family methyltransferase